MIRNPGGHPRRGGSPPESYAQLMSGMTVFGIVLIAFLAMGLAIVAGMFWWGAREDGRDQERTNALLRRGSQDDPYHLR